MDEREKIKQAIEHLETQRSVLGDSIVDASIDALRQQLGEIDEEKIHRHAMKGERRLATVVFADLSGFTSMSEEMEPEAVRELINSCFEKLALVIIKFGGLIEKFIGDEIMAIFGAPITYEDDAERALLASLEVMETIADFNDEMHTNLDLHVGVNSGMVVAGSIGAHEHQQYGVVGDMVNVAKRLCDSAEHGEIYLGPNTYKLTSKLFSFDDLKPLTLKGKAEPIQVYRLKKAKVSKPKVRGIQGIQSELVGRDEELEGLKRAIQGLEDKKGGVFAVIGGAGLGKSRLIAEARKFSHNEMVWVEGRAMSYTQEMAYWVARDVLRGLLGVRVETPVEEVSKILRSIINKFPTKDVWTDIEPYLASMLDLPLDEDGAGKIRQLSPMALQERILQAFFAFVHASCQHSMVLVWEDMHWADTSSFSILERLIPLTAETPLLLIIVFRPEKSQALEFHKRLSDAIPNQYQAIQLHQLTRSDSYNLIDNLIKIEVLPEHTIELILEKSEGNPFFLEEILRSLIDVGLLLFQDDHVIATEAIHHLDRVDVPDTLQGVISARIDLLSSKDKYTLQTASVVGRLFQRRVLKFLLEQDQSDIELDNSLDELQRNEFIRLRELLAGGQFGFGREYIFKHVLTQETAYNGLLKTHRKTLHKLAGEAIESLLPDRLGELAATLAYHYERAELTGKAIQFLLLAGEKAVRLSANHDAIKFFSRGLNLHKKLPDQEKDLGVELKLQIGMFSALSVIEGYASPDVEQIIVRARAICDEMGNLPHLVPALSALHAFYWVRGNSWAAREVSGQIMNIAHSQTPQDPVLIMAANWNLGADLFMLGELASSRILFEEAIDLYNPALHRDLAVVYVQDPKMACLAWLAHTLWFLGYPDQARKASHRAIDWADELAHPHSQAFALTMASWLYQLSGNVPSTLRLAERAIALSSDHQMPFWMTFASVFQGWGIGKQGNVQEGIEHIRKSLYMCQATGSEVLTIFSILKIAELNRNEGKIQEELHALGEAEELAKAMGFNHVRPEIKRLQGEYLLLEGKESEAEGYIDQAIQIALRQDSKSLELRAVLGMCHLRMKQGKHKDALKRLKEIYSWFNEGFETADLKQAATMIEELSVNESFETK